MPPNRLPAYRAAFPKLTDDNHKQSSKYDPRYNCIGYAAGTRMWWQPTPLIGGPYKYLVRPDADEAKDGETDEDDYVVLVSEIEPDEDDKFGSEAETDAELEAEKPESAAYRVPVRPQFQPDPPIGQTAVQKEPARVEG